MATFDLNILPIHRQNGQEFADLPGLLAVAPLGRYMIEKFVRIPVAVDSASEFRDLSPIIPKGTMLITISQSGETADTLAVQ